MGKDNYWIDFWTDYTANLKETDEQSQVLRTQNKKPISEELWKYTLQKIDSVFEVEKGDEILDL